MSSDRVSQIQIGCNVDAIRKVAEWLRDGCKDIDPDYLAEMELAVVEAVTNLVKHGGVVNTDEKLSFEMSRQSDAIKIVITDRGKPISPAALDVSATALDFDPQDVANLPTNGLGLAIIREVMDDFDYQSRDGINTMRLVKRI